MSIEVARKAVDFYLDKKISGNERNLGLTFFGGEPFLELDLMEDVVAYSRRARPNCYKKIRFSATTNGTVASPRVERLVRDAGMGLLISFDGTHESSESRPFASGRDAYDVVERNLPRLLSWTHLGMVRMTFHPRSLDFVSNVKHAIALGARSIALCPVIEAQWDGYEHAVEEAYQALAEFYMNEARRGRPPGLEVTVRALHDHHAAMVRGTLPSRPCAVGTFLLGIDPSGGVMPCHRFPYRKHDWLGTVDSPDLSPERERFTRLSTDDFPDCARCSARAICGGGCRAVALNAGLALNEAHPAYCMLTRAHERAVRRIYETLMEERNKALLQMLAVPIGDRGALGELATR
jgi:uncharacterized protein